MYSGILLILPVSQYISFEKLEQEVEINKEYKIYRTSKGSFAL